MVKTLFKPRYSLFFVIITTICVLVIFSTERIRYDRQFSATFQSPLPGIAIAELADRPFKTEAVYQKPYDFGIDFFTQKIPVWKKIFEPFKGNAGLSYLEVGVFEGRSLIWMLENILTDPNANATAIDIFYGDYEDKYLANLELTGVADKVTTIKDYSQLAMRKLPFESFDIVNIDGSHVKNDVLEDAVISWRLVKKGGLLIFDDYIYAKRIKIGNRNRDEFCKPAIDAFALCFDDYFEVIHNGTQLILRRKH